MSKRCFNLFVQVAVKNSKTLPAQLHTWRLTRSGRSSILLLYYGSWSGKENPNWTQSYKESPSKLKYDQNQTQSNSDPEPIQSHCASHSIRKYSPLQHQDAQDILAHRLQISATISRLKVLCLRVWTSYHQSFVWSKVFPLDQWKSKKLAEREEWRGS